jgi:L-arabinose isomerase
MADLTETKRAGTMRQYKDAAGRDRIESFEVTQGQACGDLLSEPQADRKLKVGLFACGYFEYWRMYPGLRERVQGDMDRIARWLGERHEIVYPGFIDTLDGADAAGKRFRDKQVDLLLVTEGTYCPDYFVHQALTHLPDELPLCLFASQPHGELDFKATYADALRSSGPMGLAQLAGGFRKMGKYRRYEVVVGPLDEAARAELDRFIQVRTTITNLRRCTYGMIGHVFRGMFDFHFDKTAVAGVLGPHVLDIDIRHLITILEEVQEDDARIDQLCGKVRSTYLVDGLEEIDIRRSARLAIALRELVARYRLNGLILLGQHFIELQANATTYLGLSEILASDQAEVATEGDVLGCIMSKVLKDFTGHTAFFGEWEEVDLARNAVLLLGHGFIDPREARRDRRVKVNPACEAWGFEGNSLGFEATYEPGPVTLTHVIHDADGWRLFVSEGEILNLPPLSINESSLIVRVEKPVREYFRELLLHGFAHHVMAAPGRVAGHLECLAGQLGLAVCRL